MADDTFFAVVEIGTGFKCNPHRLIGALVLAAALLLPAGSALAAPRYAEPAGDGPAATCPQSDPCDLDTAVENAAVVDGDEVIVTPGTYNVAQLVVTDAITIHGDAAQPRPTINTTAVHGIFLNDAATLRDLDTVAASQGAINVNASGATLERVAATATASGAIVCWVHASVTIRDSICASTATNSNGIGANSGLPPANVAITLRNVTAAGTTRGLSFNYSGAGLNVTIDAKSVIASGPTSDVGASASGNATIQMTLAHSNYNTEFENGTKGGTASVTDPGTGTGNQTALPLFVNAGAGDYHQLSTSPTIDAGVVDGSSGASDLDGDPRSLDGNETCPDVPVADIGADEYVAVAPDCDPPETSISGGPTGTTSDSTPTFDLAADEIGSTFECRVDAGAFAPCTTPFTTPELADGPHTVEARATDLNGNTDPTPATRSFTVDAIVDPPTDTDAPETTISSAPKRNLKSKKKRVRVEFAFGADEAASFECALDGAAFAPCASPFSTRVGKGRHTFAVRATDAAGNRDGSPATSSFKVKRKRKKH